MAVRPLSLLFSPPTANLPKVNFCPGVDWEKTDKESEFLLELDVQTGGRQASTCQLVLGKGSFLFSR